MKVVREDLEGTIVQRLVVTDPEGLDHHVGECLGYLCGECQQADETLQQIWHEPDCQLAGRHGRQHYSELVPDVPGRPTPEFDPAHPITVLRAGETDDPQGIHNGEVIAFVCECGNADEDLFEIVHDEACPLAGGCGLSAREELDVAAADGGRPRPQ